MSDDQVKLSRFVNLVRQHQQRTLTEQTTTVEQSVASVLAANEESWRILQVDGPLIRDDLEDRAIDALVASQRISSLFTNFAAQGNDLRHLLSRIVPNSTRFPDFAIIWTPMSTPEADAVFTLLQSSATLSHFALCTPSSDYNDGVYVALEGFLLTTTSLESLVLDWNPSCTLSAARFTSICKSIERSPSIVSLNIKCPTTNWNEGELTRAAASLAHIFVNSTCLMRLSLSKTSNEMFESFDAIQEALLSTPAVRNFEFTFQVSERRPETTRVTVTLTRSNPWKRVLPQTFPLALWSRILSKADQWKQETSHSSLDAIFFLVKEKNDVLLQNVRKRRIRKRKRFHLSS